MAPDNEWRNIKDQFNKLPRVSGVDLTGRVVLVTGGSGGLGYEAALTFAKLNPSRLILTARSVASGEKAIQQILHLTGYKCEVWVLDLMNLKSVESFAQKAKIELERLDILLSNAGVAPMKYQLSVHGYESACQVNNISNSLLCLLLLPLLIQTSTLPPPVGSKSATFNPHLTITSSGLQYKVHGLPGLGPAEEGRTMELMSKEARFSIYTYQDTKAINILNAESLISLLPPTSNGKPSVIINTIDPGFCDTGLQRSATGIVAVVISVFKFLLARTPEVGARNITYGCLAETSQGAYIASCQEEEAGDFVISESGKKIGAAIWEEMKAIWMKEGVLV